METRGPGLLLYDGWFEFVEGYICMDFQTNSKTIFLVAEGEAVTGNLNSNDKKSGWGELMCNFLFSAVLPRCF